MRRKIDDLGRVVIPAEFRRALDIGEGDELEVARDGRRLIITTTSGACTFCGAEVELTTFRGQAVCWSCTAALRALDREHRDERPAPRTPFG